MGGLFLDVWIAYLIKLILRSLRGWGSSSWQLVKCKIESSLFDKSWAFNCPTVYITYAYDFEGQSYYGEDSKPFLNTSFAKERVERFRPGEMAMVKVNPRQPQKSILK